ncbi:hypothetical protein OG897_26220 [Streptomyces sp. NBC_00237]|uniref:BTAD domain-containing putative transcriptional regulator n=1 Tax=Streptomyces sp. NBC_00237 TaxID=2975687 RepID=UPI00224E5DA4|nr:BTAD domain-containing putative transcriptional regulator [Streptomyces sp. NBC_00237]MCX5204938.1 hypothetical protein [Streptomyces sp. NBC_00237]
MARTTTTPPTTRPASPPRPRRGFGDFVKAFLAFVALAALVVGVPVALASVFGWPLPHEVPSLDVLRSEISVNTFIGALTVVVWLAWAQFTACVLVEVKAAVSGVGMPSRVPGAGASQALARQLVAAVLLLSAGAAGFAPGVGQLGEGPEQVRAPVAVSAQQSPGAEAGERAAAEAVRAQADAALKASGQAPRGSTKFYRIQPPEGRHHDSLWEIAERHLGDGRRYGEIYRLNKDREQPDGSKLSRASLIRPGWIMEMPGDARGGELVEMPASPKSPQTASPEVPDASGKLAEQIAQYDTSRTGANGSAASPGRLDDDTRQIAIPSRRPAKPSVPEVAAPAPAPAPAPAHEQPAAEASSFGLPEALLASPLLAAGLLAALGRRRRTALWQSAMAAGRARRGMEPPVPAGAAADAQDALLVGADPEAVAFLDRALRGLAAALAAAHRPLPVAYAAWLTEGELHIQLAQPSGEPPAPWRTGQDPTFWMITRPDAEAYETSGTTADAPAPYPGLVSFGTRESTGEGTRKDTGESTREGTGGDARLLLNLEALPGLVSLSGPAASRTAVLASVAAELATSGWADRMAVTLVGFGAELTALAPTRLRHLDDVEALLDTLGAESRQRAHALGNAGHDSVLTGRGSTAGRPTPWAPHLVLLATDPTEEEAAHLAQLAVDSGRLGIGYLVGTSHPDLPGATWQLEVTDRGRLLAPLLGLDLKAQLLPTAQREAVVELFSRTAPEDGIADSRPFLVDLTEQGRPAVYARLVGPYELIGPETTPDASRSPLLYEALALLLLHREGVHPRVLASALWPRGVTDDVRDALIARLGDWLGTDPDGTARLATDDTGRLTLAPSVVSDLDVLRSLHHEATAGRGAEDPRTRERLLTDALGLARGPLLADRTPGRYTWLTHEIVDAQLPLMVADVALSLAESRRERGRPERAVEALDTGLTTAPSDERLWNELLRALHALGDEPRLRAAVRDLASRSGPSGIPPRTEALLDELLPGWRGEVPASA